MEALPEGFFFDRYEKALKIVATGSARMDVYRRGGDSLMGRSFSYRVHPLSVGELASSECDLEAVFQKPKDMSHLESHCGQGRSERELCGVASAEERGLVDG